jgi:hypothetical protein
MKTTRYIRIMATSNFLQKISFDQIRQSILDIDDSYNHDWDILAELLQNSVDAIRKTERNDGNIQIDVNCQNYSITVSDNGTGIDPEKIEKLLSLFGTDKKGDEQSIGEKGVGLKFTMFSCNDFSIKSGNEKGCTLASVKDAYSWKTRTDESPLLLEHDIINEDFKGTIVSLKNIPDTHPIFELTLPQLVFILRTKTAIGNTKTIWDANDINISVNLLYTSPDGADTFEIIPFRYWLPTDGLSDKDKLNLNDYYAWVNEPGKDRDNNQKRNKLKNKIIYWTRIFELNNRDIKAVCCIVPSRPTWDTLSESFGLATPEQLQDANWVDKYGYTTFNFGIYMSVKGMPTGISIEPPRSGSAGTWAQTFIMFEDIKLKFDIGRKAIHGKTKNTYKEYARKIFNEYITNVSKYVAGDIAPEVNSWDKDEIFKDIEGMVDLKSQLSVFTKSPKDQEASVAALFFEAIGSKLITDIKPLTAGYKNKYDLYAYWGSKRVVIEFKSNLYKIVKDWDDAVKMFSEINCIVCWDVSEQDEQVLKDEGLTLEKIEPDGLLNKNLTKFPNATHSLILSGLVDPIYIIDMKMVLKA